MTNKSNQSISKQFHASFKWTLSGSFVYETCKVAHCLLLMKFMPTAMYGTMGSLFSIIYLVTYIADLGATNSLPPFIHLMNKSKENFKVFLLKYSLFPHAPLIIGCAGVATYIAATKFTDLPFLWIIPSIIFLETTRTFLRMLLHATFLTKHVVSIEIAILIAYLAMIWVPVAIFNQPISLNTIFIPHLIDSFVCVGAFVLLVRSYHRSLPDAPCTIDSSLPKRLLTTRLFNYLLRVTRNMFTSNFLTPLFAWRFGLVSAGTFYIASVIVNSLQSVIKSTIWYPGNALLANVKEESQAVKMQAFTSINNKLMSILAPVIIIIALNIDSIVKISKQPSITNESFALALLFLLISFAEFFFLLYEQLYIIEEAASKLFLFKLTELIALYVMVRHSIITSPVATLIALIVVRSISFAIIATNAWSTWHIALRFYASRWVIASSIAAGLLVSFALKYIIIL
jgi:hypothetical protein